jgi:hypothetical protein
MPSTYGLLSKTDIEILERILTDIVEARVAGLAVTILEIGVWNGNTARSMRDFLKSKGTPIAYTGIENGVGSESELKPPFDGACRIIKADSIAARAQVYDYQQFDLVLIDGCHCLTHACMDFLCYQSLVTPGGYALFHDINPAFQHVPQHHASKDHESMPLQVAVVDALKLLGLLDNKFPGWSGRMTKYEPEVSNGFFVARKLTS